MLAYTSHLISAFFWAMMERLNSSWTSLAACIGVHHSERVLLCMSARIGSAVSQDLHWLSAQTSIRILTSLSTSEYISINGSCDLLRSAFCGASYFSYLMHQRS
jgi:hypothetical protein